MKRLSLVVPMTLLITGMAFAQGLTAANDVLGAHNGYGRGCVMCHAPHGGALGNGNAWTAAGSDPNNGQYALWGQNLVPFYNLSTAFSGDGVKKYPVTLPGNPTAGAHDALTVIMMCLSCHDGSLTKPAMMTGTTVEILPVVGGHAPTLFGTTVGNTSTYYANEHPVGPYAVISCGGGYNWDCAGGDTTKSNKNAPSTVTPGAAITMTGSASSNFVADNPSSFWNNWSYASGITAPTGAGNTYSACNTAGVTGTTPNCTFSNPLSSFSATSTVNGVSCTTCHDQHSMTIYTNSMGSFTTMFFIRGQYTPSAGGNAVAQFCRNCHGGESNEMHGLNGVPTT